MRDSSYPRTIVILVQRHGDKEVGKGDLDAQLTQLGRDQVRIAIQTYLVGTYRVGHFSCSPIDRTRDTTIIARNLLGTGRIYPDARLGFDGLPTHEYKDAMQLAATVKARGETTTIADFMRWMPDYTPLAKKRFGEGVLATARKTAKTPDNDVGYAASHSPLSELLVLEPEATPNLGVAGILRYDVEVQQGGRAKVVGSRVIFAGF